MYGPQKPGIHQERFVIISVTLTVYPHQCIKHFVNTIAAGVAAGWHLTCYF